MAWPSEAPPCCAGKTCRRSAAPRYVFSVYQHLPSGSRQDEPHYQHDAIVEARKQRSEFAASSIGNTLNTYAPSLGMPPNGQE